jgi:hypothetical protein
MPNRQKFVAFILAVVFFIFQGFTPLLSAQATSLTPQELDQLLSPIALYPDSLLSQIMTASTNPQEILDVDNWVYSNPGLTGTALTDAAQQQGFDPAFIALVSFPQILEMMAQHVDDYAAIGQAFMNDQSAVSDSIQRLRGEAYAAGSLRSNAQQTVQVQQAPGQTIYVIQPANPQVVYVPQYDPTMVYAGPSTGAIVAGSLITFGAGIAIGALIASNQPWGWGGWGWNWGARRVYYNHVYWGGWPRPYRPPNPWYRPRPIVWRNRPGYGGNWGYRPPNYRPPYPGNRPVYGRPPYGPGNRPGYRPPGNRPTPMPSPGNPGTRPPNRPGTPVTRPTRPGQPTIQPTPTPQPRPTPNQPGRPSRPAQPGRPSIQPKPAPVGGTRPTNPGQPRPTPSPAPNRPPGQNRPSQGRPTSQPSRPVPQPKPSARPTPQPKPAPPPNAPRPQG